MVDFLLVHGGAHGAWCWAPLMPHLLADPRVRRVVASDLCGHGARLEAKPQAEITLADYHQSVIDDLVAHDLRDVVLVGHSMAGITIPAVAHRAADRVRQLVYLTTTNPPRGRSVLDSMDDPRSPVASEVDVEEAFCSDLDAPTRAWLLGNLGPQPSEPMNAPVEVVRGPAGIPQTYIVCEEDAVLPPDYQRDQAQIVEADRVLSIDAGHSAFASRPLELSRLLLGLL